MNDNEPKWLAWAKSLQAIAQNGLIFAENHFDIERYESVRVIAADIMASYTRVDKQFVLDLFNDQSGYATPKVDVRGVVFQGDKVLLVKEVVDGCWTLPGGWADPNEMPSEAAAREVWEESGYEVKPVKLLMVYDRSKHGHEPPMPFHVYKLFFLCELVRGEVKTSMETSAVGFFGENEMPPLSLARLTPSEVVRLFEHYRNPTLLTDFD
jgi:ADP-ribose pyrophosphatase YjhB (NUDIX family)